MAIIRTEASRAKTAIFISHLDFQATAASLIPTTTAGQTFQTIPFGSNTQDGHGTTPHDPVCRDIVHTGLNVRSSDGRMTGALLPVGVPAKPGMVIKARAISRRSFPSLS